jgi:hypothetical protein
MSMADQSGSSAQVRRDLVELLQNARKASSTFVRTIIRLYKNALLMI